MNAIRKVVVLGANGVMGSGAGALFAGAGIPTIMLARTSEKADAGKARAEQLIKRMRGSSAPRDEIAHPLGCGTYDSDLLPALAEADLVIEAVVEDLGAKRQVFALIDRVRNPRTIVATVSSGLSIAAICAERSEAFRQRFLGVHLFNPPTSIVGCELIAHPETDPGVVAITRELLTRVARREVIETADTPGFAGNRLGFKLLNQIAQLAAEHGVLFMDQLLGSHTGRALPPLATIDLVGWDVHEAIVDNLWANTCDVAHPDFELPEYMRRGIEHGHLGRKTRDKGGFYRIDGTGPEATQLVLDPASEDFRPVAEVIQHQPVPAVVERMKTVVREDGLAGAMDAMCTATGHAAELLRSIVLGYISYGLGLVGEVVEHPRDIDRIMGFGFSWAPPSMLVDAIGAARTIRLLERAHLPVPDAVADAAQLARPLFNEPNLDPARFFKAA